MATAAEWGRQFEALAYREVPMIHIVEAYGGSYDDAWETVLGCFTDKVVAEIVATEYDINRKLDQASAEKEYNETDFNDELSDEEYGRINNAYYDSLDYTGTRVRSYEMNKKLYEEAL